MGFNVLHWADCSMQDWPVPDLDRTEVEHFTQLWQQRVAAQFGCGGGPRHVTGAADAGFKFATNAVRRACGPSITTTEAQAKRADHC